MNISTIINAINEFEKLAQQSQADPKQWKDAHDLATNMINVGTKWVDAKVSAILKKPANGQVQLFVGSINFEPLPGQNDFRYVIMLDSKFPDIRKWLSALEVELNKYLTGKFPGERLKVYPMDYSQWEKTK